MDSYQSTDMIIWPEIITFFLLFVASTESTCPDDFIFESGFNKCYKFLNTPLTFLLAEQKCQQFGGNLVAIANGFENSYVTGYVAGGTVSGSYWIGASLLTSRTWSWTSGASFAYSNWAPNQPADPSTEQCVSARDIDVLWFKELCNTAMPFVCQIDPNDPTPSPKSCATIAPTTPASCTTSNCPMTANCPYDYTLYHGNCQCYKAVTDFNKFEQAVAYCAEEGGHLAFIKSQNETDFLVNLYASTGYTSPPFIGLQCTTTDPNNCHWTDGTPLGVFRNFANGYPQGGSNIETYMYIIYQNGARPGQWATPPIYNIAAGSICQKDPYKTFDEARKARQKGQKMNKKDY